ncbi:HNH endonuclease [Agrobacterium fabrum]|uniref:HNH endonuclease n=1 Tax=Agrobacterium fabrum TaxID=1176649 RepID=UPI0015731A4D|nr:HNH endonuclease signature motif containing protein [Agrobacterium fabrum]WCK77575.1 HNH endonuclease signature motif containing protein [Agrobacterium fabrum]
MPKPYGRSAEAALYRRMYKTARWQRLREAQLDAEPLCRFCLAIEDVTEATVCDHVKPHRGDEVLFYDPGNLQSLCAPCHDTLKARIERGQQAVVIGVDGYPVEVGG